MLTVDYFGRTGNILFQYVFTKLLENKFNQRTYTPEPDLFLPIQPYKPIVDPARGYTFIVGDHNNLPCYDGEFFKDPNSHVHLHGYFQDVYFYNQNRELIKTFFDLPPVKKNTEDVVVHLRLTDYWWYKVDSVISPGWYLDRISNAGGKKCYIVVEKHPTNEAYLKHFKGVKNVEIVTGGKPIDDFLFIRNFDKIICSNSSFCWWAAFLSEASKIYTFRPWLRHKKLNLAKITGAKHYDGKYHLDRRLKTLPWSEYWKKDIR